ncbi:hypothetical protein PS645_01839 [Pseudomonas fluorescens]|jgi:hypothetical protein|uniref:Uncharacterized protein n=1 Tax=Pseudomonas fluorescens TaxID=294 RepID=A0A5E6RUT5_PSEFL|nr:hypothetical protein PS645_01839 [Pseudomonas fluorescens]
MNCGMTCDDVVLRRMRGEPDTLGTTLCNAAARYVGEFMFFTTDRKWPFAAGRIFGVAPVNSVENSRQHQIN